MHHKPIHSTHGSQASNKQWVQAGRRRERDRSQVDARTCWTSVIWLPVW